MNEFKIKHGLRIDESQVITGITTSITNANNYTLVTESAVKNYVDTSISTSSTGVSYATFNQYTGVTAPSLYASILHTGNTSNPHNVTAQQISAYTYSQSDVNFVSATTFNTFTANTLTSQSAFTTWTSFNQYTGVTAPSTFTSISHTGNTDNPHNVTTQQISAVTLSTFTSHTADTTIHFTKNSINLDDLGDVDTVGTVQGYYLSYSAGTWKGVPDSTDLSNYYNKQQVYNSAETNANFVSASTYNTFTASTLLSQSAYTLVADFISHTGQTNPHGTYFSGLTQTAHTHLWSDLTITAHTHEQYLTGFTETDPIWVAERSAYTILTNYNTYTGVTASATFASISHTGNTDNPHNVTAAQISAYTYSQANANFLSANTFATTIYTNGINNTGDVTATTYYGDGSYLTGVGNAVTLTLSWKFDTTITGPGIASGDFRYNSATSSAITEVYVNYFTTNGVDVSTVISKLRSGTELYIQQKDDAGKAILFVISSNAIDNTTYYTIPVTYEKSVGTVPTNNKDCLIITFNGPTVDILSAYTLLTTFNEHVSAYTYYTGVTAPNTFATITNLNSHTGNTNNPHNVTIAQISGVPLSDFNTYTGNTLLSQSAFTTWTSFYSHTGQTNPHGTTFASLVNSSHTHLWSDISNTSHTHNQYLTGFTETDPIWVAERSAYTILTQFNSHTGDTSNPHNVTAQQISAYTYLQSDAKFVYKTGDTMTGHLTVPTLSAQTIGDVDLIQFNTGSTVSAIAGTLFYDENNNALSYKPKTTLNNVTINIGQEHLIIVHNNSGSIILNGQACHINGSIEHDAETHPTAILSNAANSIDEYYVAGIATHDIGIDQDGFITKLGLVHDLSITGVTEGSDMYLSDTVPGGYIYDYTLLAQTSKIVKLGRVISTGLTTATILVDISYRDITYASAGLLTSPSYLNNLNGTMTLNQIGVSLYNNSTFLNIAEAYIITSAITNTNTGVSVNYLTVVNNTTNYIVVNYNNGSPRYEVIQDVDLITESSVIPVVTLYRSDIYFHNLNWDSFGIGLANKLNQRLVKTQRIVRESGLAISTSGGTGQATGGYGDAIRISEGKTWNGGARQNIIESYSKSSATTTFFCYLSGSSSNWVIQTSGVSGFINTHYFDIDTYSLQPLNTANGGWHNVNWVYRGIEDYSHIYIVLGNDEYRYLADAQAVVTTPSSLPALITSHAILVGRIIGKQNTSTSQNTTSAFDSQFPGGMINDHNSLSNLQGGIANEYYHTTLSEHNTLTNMGDADSLHYHGSFNTFSASTLLSQSAFTTWTSFNQYTGVTAPATFASISHTGNTDNPHNVTAQQISAYTYSQSDANFVSALTYNTFTANTLLSQSAFTIWNVYDQFTATTNTIINDHISAYTYYTGTTATNTFSTIVNLNSHTGDTSNPHNVTAAQISAVTLDTAQTITGAKIFTSQVNMYAGLYVSGVTTFVNTQSMNIKDNVIVINSGETGSGVTAGVSGIRVERGVYPYYMFMFDETTDTFRVGVQTENTTTIVGWMFNNSAATADSGLLTNSARTITTTGGTNAITWQTGFDSNPYSAQATGWNSGSDLKTWLVSFSTVGYNTLTISSRQYSSASGPRDFKVQYRVGTGGVWTDVTNASLTAATDFTTGILTNVSLPSACDNQSDIYLQWIMTSNTGVNLSPVGVAGTSRIDEIYIKGASTTLSAETSLGTQAVATREDTPTDGGVALWSGGTLQFVTDSILKYSGGVLSATTFNGNLNWPFITSKPTTIAGYGITDAYTKTETDVNFVSASTFNTYMATSMSGTTGYIPVFNSNSSITNGSLYQSGITTIFTAGTTTNAPLKLTSGNLLTTPEYGAIEMNGDNQYFTINTTDEIQEIPYYQNANATSYYSVSYVPSNALNYTLLLTGTYSARAWLSANGQVTNQRFNVKLNNSIVLTKVYYENLHSTGIDTLYGAKNFTLWGSNTLTDYNDATWASTGNWVQITGLSQSFFDQHIAVDAADPKYITITGNTTSYNYYSFKIADNWGGLSFIGLRRLGFYGTNNKRKNYVLDDGTQLSSGSTIPFTTSNGRLKDSQYLTFIQNVTNTDNFSSLELKNPYYNKLSLKADESHYLNLYGGNIDNGIYMYHSNNSYFQIYQDTFARNYIYTNGVLRIDPYNGVNFAQNNVDNVSIYNGKVGIGAAMSYIVNGHIQYYNMAANLHIDGGTATASNIKFTASATTGQLATDGFDIGITSDGTAEIRQRENTDIVFYTNNIERYRVQSDGTIIYFGNTRKYKEVFTYPYNLYSIAATYNNIACTAASDLILGNMYIIKSFSATVAQAVVGTLTLPTDYEANTSIKIELSIACSAVTGVTRMFVGVQDVSVGDRYTGNAGTINYFDSNITVTGNTYTDFIGSFTVTGLTASPKENIGLVIYRDPISVADTLTASLLLMSVRILYISNSNGENIT